MLEKVKRALRIKTDALDPEIEDNILAAKADLGIAGVNSDNLEDPLIIRAIITFCHVAMCGAADYDRLKKCYDEQKAQLRMATGYTD